MPTDAEVRQVLRDNGLPVPERGKLAPSYLEQYHDLAGDGGHVAAPADPVGLPDPGSEPGESSPRGLPGTGNGERRPKRATSRGKPRSFWQRIQGGGQPGKRRARQPRVPVDRLCERLWEFLARVASPASPAVGRCLSMQSPVAGLVLEDVVAGTIADRALQPIARAEQRGEKVLALVGPPVLVAALEASQGLPEQQRMMRQAILLPMLRESMALWVDIAGDKIQAKAERDAERGPVMAQVDELIGMIFAPPSFPDEDPAAAEAMAQEAEDAEAAAAQAMAGV